ncbi:hypothetical protein [Streptococcus suis]|uniref:hypothetical protein n=1 Tax=Streptococcus suis TaxID=1307 RepID=UPI00211B8616|nr:hypothetical protein [Streptococcus suis]MCQ9225738.1 hypothetical protein [Streptococcus suis]MCQ9227974.1 hypothetical protein [Streptococcus suis]MCQ9242069.1 hypothetical protein [Streptococcus suis]MCQ9274302.1 hypothetical protein [Streptococcus suis]MDE7534584.1 hypothetical protein [Streptococcus suis]
MDNKFRYYRNPDYTIGRRKMDMLVIENLTDKLMLYQVRVNGYLLDFVSAEGHVIRRYRLKDLPLDVELTVADVEDDVDLTLPENLTYRQFDFFQNLTSK